MATKKKYGIQIAKDLYVTSMYLIGNGDVVKVGVSSNGEEDSVFLHISGGDFLTDGYSSVLDALNLLTIGITGKIKDL
jgi:hypothetical protein